ncbi:hypothetical protein MNBD_ACTINO02-1313 [hydrothermal vent metagenome]|uniref:Uncharacterized protein n=1 Tax=hydrothermal vent metagenome TaxID=652676 RepID=A0A3B0TBH9_9ZZZZ
MAGIEPYEIVEDEYRRIALLRDGVEIAAGSPALNRRDSWHAIIRGARFKVDVGDQSFTVLQREFSRFNKDRRRLEILTDDDSMRWVVMPVGRFMGHVRRADGHMIGLLANTGASSNADNETEQLLVAMLGALKVRLVLSVPWFGLAIRGF